MTKRGKREGGDDIHEHPAFRALVDDLERETPDGVNRAMDHLEEELTKEEDNGGGDDVG